MRDSCSYKRCAGGKSSIFRSANGPFAPPRSTGSFVPSSFTRCFWSASGVCGGGGGVWVCIPFALPSVVSLCLRVFAAFVSRRSVMEFTFRVETPIRQIKHKIKCLQLLSSSNERFLQTLFKSSFSERKEESR